MGYKRQGLYDDIHAWYKHMRIYYPWKAILHHQMTFLLLHMPNRYKPYWLLII